MKIGEILNWKITKTDGDIIRIDSQSAKQALNSLKSTSQISSFEKKKKKISLPDTVLIRENRAKKEEKRKQNILKQQNQIDQARRRKESLLRISEFHKQTDAGKGLSQRLYAANIEKDYDPKEIAYCLVCRKRHIRKQVCLKKPYNP